jgi:lipopolysaccharide biosynthesis regulator YciM
MANIDELMKGDRKPYYFNAIQWYYENNKDVNKALSWVAEAEKEEPKVPWFKLWESRLLLRKGDKAGAIAAAEAGIELSKESNDDEYLRLNLEALSQAKD